MPGRAGALQTLLEMKRLVIEAIQSQLPREHAIAIFKTSRITDPASYAAALHHWIQTVVILTDEFEELLRGPLLMLSEIDSQGFTSGDCDCIAMLAASMLASMGAETRLTACFPQADGSYAHVLVRYRFPRDVDFRNFDATINFQPMYPADVLEVDIVT
jgi:hypothetical protein